ncbi:hypothetical protein F4818DRAFT_360868 [Hypoxylon cercidicola]|nr:hypothetical protein F4818DRAFT_360868 [Hypoxylon cercidicola]
MWFFCPPPALRTAWAIYMGHGAWLVLTGKTRGGDHGGGKAMPCSPGQKQRIKRVVNLSLLGLSWSIISRPATERPAHWQFHHTPKAEWWSRRGSERMGLIQQLGRPAVALAVKR